MGCAGVAKRMLNRIKMGDDPNTTWYKCLVCDRWGDNLIDILFGVDQLHHHIVKYHRMKVSIYREICNSLDWADDVVTRRFQYVMMNMHEEEYDNQLWRAKGKSMAARNGNTGAGNI